MRFLTREEIVSLVVLARQNVASRADFKTRFDNLWKKSSHLDKIEAVLFENASHGYFNDDSKTHHFESWLKGINPNLTGEIKTSLSENLNDKITQVLNNELKFIERFGAKNGAVLVLKNPSSDNDKLKLVAMVGSKNFFGDFDGQVNGCVAVREAGSTLKPFIYALALESNRYKPNSIVNDRDVSIPAEEYETYRPKNYDLSYWGPMTISEALAASRNIPAVVVLNNIGVNKFYDYLKKIGFNHLKENPSSYGLRLGLGIGGAGCITWRYYISILKF